MKKTFSLLAGLALFLTATAAYASSISQTPALFETYVSSTQGTADTTLNIASATLSDGSTLSGYVCLTIDANTPSVEFECGTLTGTQVAISLRGLGYQTGTTTSSTLKKVHRTGADVKITEFPALAIIQRILSGVDSLETPVQYDNIATTTIAANRNSLASVGLLQDTAFNGAGIINASASNKGIVQLATQLQAASSTASGSTGALLVIPASSATSTYNAATAALRVVVTGNNGLIDPNFISTSFSSSTVIGNTYAFDIGKNERVFTASSTWAVPNGIHKVFVRLVGGGGTGAANNSCSTGGSAAGYAEGVIDVSATTSVNVIVGAAAGSSATTTSSFGWPTFGIAATVGGNGGNCGSGACAASASAGGIGIGGTFSSSGAQAQSCLAPASGSYNAGVGAQSLLGQYGQGGISNSGAGTNGAVILQW